MSNDLFEVLSIVKGAALVGARYTPLFDYFVAEYGATAFRVVADTYVTDDAGTGIVHQAPAFGEDDFRVCIAAEVVDKRSGRLPCPVDANGRFTSEVPEFAGVHVKAADDGICAALKARGRLFSKATLVHSYPFCWRSDVRVVGGAGLGAGAGGGASWGRRVRCGRRLGRGNDGGAILVCGVCGSPSRAAWRRGSL